MDAWVWILIAVIVLVVLWLVWRRSRKRKRDQLQEQFGPEYDRAVETKGGRSEAETELQARAKRRDKLDIRPLSPAAREGYERSWKDAQADFVDRPPDALGKADRLVQEVMKERGYPVCDFEQRSDDLSVDHPTVVASYRDAHSTSKKVDSGDASTEDMRQAMQQYRNLFEELLDRDSGGNDQERDDQNREKADRQERPR